MRSVSPHIGDGISLESIARLELCGYADGIRYRFILPSPETMLETFRGLELRLTTERVHDVASCVALGCGKSLKWINSMQEGTINLARRKLMKD